MKPAVTPKTKPNSAVLLLQCPERKGVVAAVANFIYSQNGSIAHADEHQDPDLGLFMMRVEWSLADFKLPIEHFAHHFEPIAKEFGMTWRIAVSNVRPRVAIFVSRSGHCLADLLYRHQIGELPCEIPLVISNHDDQRALARFYKIPFHRVGVSPDSKDTAERETFAILEKAQAEMVV